MVKHFAIFRGLATASSVTFLCVDERRQRSDGAKPLDVCFFRRVCCDRKPVRRAFPRRVATCRYRPGGDR